MTERTDEHRSRAPPEPGRRPPGSPMALAVGLVYLVVVSFRRWDVLLASVATLSALVVAAWFAVSRRGTPGAVALVVGVVALVLFDRGHAGERQRARPRRGPAPRGRLDGQRRLALHQPSVDPSARTRRRRPRHAVLIMNPWSGGGKVERFALEQLCRERGIEPIVLGPGCDLLAIAEDAVQRGADVIGMAGGDGSQALVASVASRHGVPFVVVPAGTRNHFALDLGLDRADVVGALDAFDDGVDRRIDLAEVNGRVFVNNASMGLYAKIVQSAAYRDAKVATAADILPDLIGPDAAPLDLRFTLPSGEEATSANLVLVSNNSYQLSHLRGAATRPLLDDGLLGIVSVLVRGGAGCGEGSPRSRPPVRCAGSPGGTSGPATEFEVYSAGPGGGGRRRGGPDDRPAAALRHPAGRAHGAAAEGGAVPPHGASGRAHRLGPDPGRPVAHGPRTTGVWAHEHRRPRRAGRGATGPAPRPAVAGDRARSSTGRPGCCTPRLGRYDLAAYTAVARMSTPVLDVPLRRLSHFANLSKPWFLTAAGLALLGGPTGRRAAVTGVAAIGAASLLVNQPMKLLGDRRRPDREDHDVPEARWVPMPTSTSFPSGHSASAVAFAVAVVGRGPGPARATRCGRGNRGVLEGVRRRPLPRRRPRRGGDGSPARTARLPPGRAGGSRRRADPRPQGSAPGPGRVWPRRAARPRHPPRRPRGRSRRS